MAAQAVTFEELATAATAATAATSQATPAAAETKTPESATAPAFTESDASAYRKLVDAGITPQNYQEFLQAKQALSNLDTILRTNPDLFLDEIEKSDPQLHKLLLDKFSDRWYLRQPEEVRNGTSAAASSASSTANSPEVSVLKSKLEDMGNKFDSLVSRLNQEQTEKQAQAITDGFNSVLDGYEKKLPEKLDERQKDHIRLKAQELIWKDPAARARCAKGVYVDVAKYFTDATKFVTAETKAAAQQEASRREAVEANGQRTIPAAAEPTGGTPVQTDRHVDPIWGNISQGEVNSALSRK